MKLEKRLEMRGGQFFAGKNQPFGVDIMSKNRFVISVLQRKHLIKITTA